VSTDKRSLARQALTAALRIRQANGKTLIQPLCPFDLALALEIDLWFKSLPSLEGMYSSLPRPAIIIGTERPSARQTYTCAHEIGHHVFGHGTKVDEIRPPGSGAAPFDPEEFLAQAFAGFLLVPKLAIDNALKTRHAKLDTATSADFYRLASFFGVGYTTLIRHLRYSLQCVSREFEEALTGEPLKKVRAQFGVSDPAKQLIVVDHHWSDMAADLEIGDHLLAPAGCRFEGLSLMQVEQVQGGQIVFEAVARGQGRLHTPSSDWSCFVRVRPKKFTGRAIFRHLPEEPNDD
jgi:Zn-dependent peptidase ImmA (M78 family)